MLIHKAIKPAEYVEASDIITSENSLDIVKWIRESGGEAATFSETPFDATSAGICIDTKTDGTVWAANGSVIIRNKSGEFSVIRQKAFEEQYKIQG